MKALCQHDTRLTNVRLAMFVKGKKDNLQRHPSRFLLFLFSTQKQEMQKSL